MRPARRSAAGIADQRLHLGHQRAAALQRDGHAGAGDRLAALGQEQPGRVGQLDDAGLAELEAADLVGRAEAVLHRADHPQLACRSPSKCSTTSTRCSSKRGPGDRPVLGDVADQHGGQRPLLGQRGQRAGDLADLGDPAGHAVDTVGRDRLHRVDDEQARLDRLDVLEQRGEVGLGGEVEVRR